MSVKLHDPAVAVAVRHEEVPGGLHHRHRRGLAEVPIVAPGDELLSQDEVRGGLAWRKLRENEHKHITKTHLFK